MLISFVADHEMDVCGTEGVAVHHSQELSGRTVIGDLCCVSDWVTRRAARVD
jgi:hypothetical protein